MEDTAGTDDFMVFLKTYEQAKCELSPNTTTPADNTTTPVSPLCTFTWVADDIATVTNNTVAFDSTLNDYVLTLTGTNFGANDANT